jgi:thioesterase domain-containing protein
MRAFLLVAACLVALTAMSGDAQAAGHIYLLRGFANIFSTGMDTLAEELVSRGYKATVHSAGESDTLATEAANLQKSGKGPIIIVGHSLGADAAISMAEKMKDLGARVALIVAFGPTYNESAPSNVARIINYYQASSIVNAKIVKGPGFTGSISNINLDASSDITHFNIEKNSRLHTKTIAYIAMIAGRGKEIHATPLQ